MVTKAFGPCKSSSSKKKVFHKSDCRQRLPDREPVLHWVNFLFSLFPLCTSRVVGFGMAKNFYVVPKGLLTSSHDHSIQRRWASRWGSAKYCFVKATCEWIVWSLILLFSFVCQTLDRFCEYLIFFFHLFGIFVCEWVRVPVFGFFENRSPR